MIPFTGSREFGPDARVRFAYPGLYPFNHQRQNSEQRKRPDKRKK